MWFCGNRRREKRTQTNNTHEIEDTKNNDDTNEKITDSSRWSEICPDEGMKICTKALFDVEKEKNNSHSRSIESSVTNECIPYLTQFIEYILEIHFARYNVVCTVGPPNTENVPTSKLYILNEISILFFFFIYFFLGIYLDIVLRYSFHISFSARADEYCIW